MRISDWSSDVCSSDLSFIRYGLPLGQCSARAAIMYLYLPIANLSVNAFVIIGLGGVVGVLSGMFGVGGGFLTTPLLIFYGIPPTVAAASAATQVTGASVRSAERRVGKECVSTCRSRCSRDH